MFRWAHKPWVWNEITNEYFYINNPPAKWKCHFFHRKRQKIHYWTTGKRWFLEPINPKWSFFLRAGLDIGETGWQLFLSYNGAWIKNKETGEFFLTKDGFSQSITASKGPSQWRQGTCSDQKGNWIRYWFSGNRWFLEPQTSEEKWTPPPGGELLWLNSFDLPNLPSPFLFLSNAGEFWTAEKSGKALAATAACSLCHWWTSQS